MAAKPTSAPAHQPPDLSSLYLAITEHAPLPMATVEGASHIVRYVNPAFCRLMDKSTKQLVGKPFCEMLPKKDKCLALLDRVYRTGKSESHTEQQHSKPHPVFWSYTMWPVLADERPVGVMIQVTETAQFHEKTLAMNEALILGSVRQHELTEAADSSNVQLQREITERKQVEAALRESEERYRTLFELGPVAVYSCDASGVIQNFNRRAAELWDREPALGDTDERFCGSFKLFRPDGSFMPHEQCPMAEVLSGQISEARDAEVLIERPDGSRVTVVVNIRPLKNQRGEVTGAINCFYDITERKQAEEARRDILARFRVLADNIPTLCWTAKADGWIFWFNRRWYEYTGTTPQSQEGWGWASVHDPEALPAVMERWKASIATGQPFEMVFPLKGADGVFRPFLTRIVPLRDEEGRIVHWFGTNTDITNERKAEERQHFLMNELAHRSQNLLAVIQSIVSRSLSGTRSLAEAREVLTQRIQALARSQSVLVTEGFVGAPVADIIRLEFEAFSDRIKAGGPDVMLNPRVAQTFALVVHELATNAAKHGALSGPGGHIAIHWSIEGAGTEARFKFQWQELDGPPVAPPTRQGFGRILLEKAVASDFDAQPKIRFAPEGLIYEIDAPLSVVATGSAGGTAALERNAGRPKVMISKSL